MRKCGPKTMMAWLLVLWIVVTPVFIWSFVVLIKLIIEVLKANGVKGL